MDEIIKLIKDETYRTRYGEIICTITMHDGEPRVITISTSRKHLIKNKEKGMKNNVDEK